MTARLTVIVIVAFWLAMNVFLWRAEYGSHGPSMPVPPQLIWKKILTAPDTSSLTIYANGERTGFCEISTGVGQEMAALDADKVPSGLSRTGYQIHTSGNLSLGDFSNRFKFDGRIRYNKSREWEELEIHISNRASSAIIHSIATNRVVEITVNSEDGKIQREFSFDDLRNPNTLLRSFAGDLAGDFDLPLLPNRRFTKPFNGRRPGIASLSTTRRVPCTSWNCRSWATRLCWMSAPLARLSAFSCPET